jgi:hypothetical protein
MMGLGKLINGKLINGRLDIGRFLRGELATLVCEGGGKNEETSLI